LGDAAIHRTTETYREALDGIDERITVCDPTSRPARDFVRRLQADGVVEVLPERGYVLRRSQFERWADGRRRLLLEDFYRDVRRLHDLLLDENGEPVGGRWNYDQENRQPPPRRVRRLADATGVPDPWWPDEDDLDAEVRDELDRWQRDHDVEFVGEDGPRRYAVTRAEAVTALEWFVEHRLDGFGPHEDAMLEQDRWLSHSVLSPAINLGLLHPLEIAQRVVRAHTEGTARLSSVEGFLRQVVGWREYVWHVYWHTGEEYRQASALGAHEPLPRWFAELDPDGEVGANCLAHVLRAVREDGWTHHIQRLMVLGNWALQRGYDPAELSDWFQRSFVDGYDWVMLPNVVGMSQHADGGFMATKPYAGGGAYINRMSDYCGGCAYDPKVRVGERACPFTAGYWAFLARVRPRLEGNPRMAQALRGLDRLADLDAVIDQERARGTAAP
ncbi:MAG TPA: cryptochrome/photolyase family protein, partial [Kineosporiaceae bacterium]|nr:cryptochrome/photolyase family protein [Kineosporiaceae bacterium]